MISRLAEMYVKIIPGKHEVPVLLSYELLFSSWIICSTS